MKNLLFAGLLLLVFAAVTGCKKDDSETSSPGISVKFDGATWTSSINTAALSTTTDVMIINATKLNPVSTLAISIEGSDVGTYTLSEDNAFNMCSFTDGQTVDDAYFSHYADIPTGQIVITDNDKTNHTISGTFKFDGYTFDGVKKVFSEGKFTKIAYMVQ